jgi:NAD(P)-dependent dehydrogenase (short-subunit alcohol dehydrogenase family)
LVVGREFSRLFPAIVAGPRPKSETCPPYAQIHLREPAKHAIIGLTRSAALNYAKQGIRVNAVAPGGIKTEMAERFTGGSQEGLDYLASLHPVGRLGTSDEIANAVLFLASDAASFITGTSLNVDGGFLAQ